MDSAEPQPLTSLAPCLYLRVRLEPTFNYRCYSGRTHRYHSASYTNCSQQIAYAKYKQPQAAIPIP
jgi:hypothetical protein